MFDNLIRNDCDGWFATHARACTSLTTNKLDYIQETINQTTLCNNRQTSLVDYQCVFCTRTYLHCQC